MAETSSSTTLSNAVEAGGVDRRIFLLLAAISFVATANAATVGYDSSMMNGLQILPSYAKYFGLSTQLVALNVAIVFVGSVIAIPIGGPISDRFGRKRGIVITALIAICGSILQGAAVHEAMFCIGRLLIGISITTGSVAAPAYIAELAHPRYRVLLTGIYAATWYVGSILAAAITFGTEYIDSTWSWRIPSLLQCLPSILCIIPMLFLPESPRWLCFQDRHEEAIAIITQYHAGGDANAPIVMLEYEEIRQTIEFEKSIQHTDFKTLVATKPNRWRFFVASATGFFSQVSGNNIITYYMGDVLDSAGVTSTQTQLAINIGLGVFNLICAILGSSYANKFGRRLGFLTSTLGMAILLIIVSVLTKVYATGTNDGSSAAQILMIFLFMGCYSLVWNPLSVVYPIEVLSYTMRANGLSGVFGITFFASFFNTYAIPYAMDWSSWGFYLITAGWCVIEAVVIFLWFPETKDLGLEEIDVIFDGITHSDVGKAQVLDGKALDLRIEQGVETDKAEKIGSD